MRLSIFLVTLWLWPLLGTSAQESPPGKVVADFWDAAYLQGGKAGHVHTYTEEKEQDGQRHWRTTVELRLTVKRNADIIQLGMDTGTTETEAGKVSGVFMRHYLGKNKQLDLSGFVDGSQLKLFLDRTTPIKPAPWDDRVVGLYRQQRLYQDRQVKPGDAFTYLSFEPSINLVVETHVRMKDWETVELFGGKQKQRLLRVETQPEKVQNVQLPTMVTWLGDDLQQMRAEVEVPGLGRIILYRTSKSLALAPGTGSKLTDIGISHLVRLSKGISRPYQATSAVYRMKIQGEPEAASTFSRDGRQEVKNVRAESFDLHVRAVKEGIAEKLEKVPADFVESSYFINCGDARVKELARRAVGTVADPWQKALRIERWINTSMKPAYHESLATADHVAKTLTGDCTEYAMLMAAMCRAEGIPARTALGLIYANTQQGPAFAFHMWTEVMVADHWMPLDATLGQGYVGATHLKIADQSWHNERSLAPLLPVVRVLGRLAIEILAVE